jgi:hypothetical protein
VTWCIVTGLMVSDVLKELSAFVFRGSRLILEDEVVICGMFFSGRGQMVSRVCRWSRGYSVFVRYEEGPKNNRNLNVARELEVVARCAALCRESRQYSSSLSLGVDLG